MQGFFLDTALEETSLANPIHCSVLVAEPPQKGNWVIERRHSLWKKKKKKHHSSIPFKTLHRFSPLNDTPTEKLVEYAQIIGDSILCNVKIETPATIVKCLSKFTNLLCWLMLNVNILRLSFTLALMISDFICLRSLKSTLKRSVNLFDVKYDLAPHSFIADCCHSMAGSLIER